MARAQCGVQGILRSERVLVGSISPDYGLEAVEPGTLASALKLEKRLSGLITSRGLPCVKTSAGSCFSLSPSVFWDHSEESILADDNVLETVNSARNVSSAGISINPEILLAGRELRDPTGPHIDGAMFLALTYFFRDRDCLDNTGHFQWLRVLEAAAGHAGDLVVQAQAPKLVALEVSFWRAVSYHPWPTRNRSSMTRMFQHEVASLSCLRSVMQPILPSSYTVLNQ